MKFQLSLLHFQTVWPHFSELYTYVWENAIGIRRQTDRRGEGEGEQPRVNCKNSPSAITGSGLTISSMIRFQTTNSDKTTTATTTLDSSLNNQHFSCKAFLMLHLNTTEQRTTLWQETVLALLKRNTKVECIVVSLIVTINTYVVDN